MMFDLLKLFLFLGFKVKEIVLFLLKFEVKDLSDIFYKFLDFFLNCLKFVNVDVLCLCWKIIL